MKIAMAQVNTSVGDILGNEWKVLEFAQKARAAGADIAIFPEMTVPGYPPKDLLLSPEFISACEEAQGRIRQASAGLGIALVIGGVEIAEGKLYNTSFVFSGGQTIYAYHKKHLPNYDVFDEKRYFASGEGDGLFELGGMRIGINICEDIWVRGGPADRQAKAGAELIINLSASPFYFGKTKERLALIQNHIKSGGVPIIYVNQVGGQDDIVFDGESYAFNAKGELMAQGKHFAEDLAIFSLSGKPIMPLIHEKAEEVYEALKLGLSDYFKKGKTAFAKAVLGLSGGVDSALAAIIAADALGPENVVCISMPSRFTSAQSIADARQLASNIGAHFREIPIDGMYDAYLQDLCPLAQDTGVSVAQENIQARIRANILYFEANSNNYLVLNTSNKSEAAVGYGTLHGDMAGGYGVILDALKTLVYELCAYRNGKAGYDIIPKSILEKAPSAELRPNQKDSDSLPPYPILDGIIDGYVEKVKSPRQIASELSAENINPEMVREVIRRIDAAEHKRKQSPPGAKITPRAFGSGRRMPIANGYGA